MQQIKNSTCITVLIILFVLFSCNDSTSSSGENDTDTISDKKSDTPFVNSASSMPAYDPAMEPLTVGAKFSKKLGDTLNMKMYEFTMKPGDSAELHTHPDHAVYVLQGGKLAITFKGTGRQIMDLKTGTGFISGALSDAGKNIGNTTVKLLVTDIYRPLGNGPSSMPDYDPAMEPIAVGAKFSKKLGDTLNIKMYEFLMKPGDSAELHTHPDHAVYVLQGGKLAITFKGTGRQIMDLKTGTGFISAALSDAGKNIGNTTVKLLVTDVYRPRAN